MECPHIPELGYGDFSKRLHEKVATERIPISGSLEVTARCNNDCVHCYINLPANNREAAKKELSYQEICSIVDQFVDEGCLWLLLTGGEPFVRSDFLDIYTYIKKKGVLITIFTNGTLVTPRIADYLAEWRPLLVEITLYGRTQETYERITGIPGSYERCMRGIDLLLERGAPLKLKTMLMTLNKHELWDIRAYAESLGVDFRFDPMVNAGLESSAAPTTFRLSPKEIVNFDLADPERLEKVDAFWKRFGSRRADPRYLYVCGAGLKFFHIDPYGKLSVCMISRVPSYDLRQGSFREGWRGFLREVRYQLSSEDYRCNRCELLALCGQCPGWARLEHDDSERTVEFLCQVAHLQAEAFGFIDLSQETIRS